MPVIIARKPSPRSPSIPADQLARLARRYAILGEGNVSVRDDAETFLVKASGAAMATATTDSLVRVDLSRALALVHDPPAGDEAVKAGRVLATALACGGPCYLSAVDVRRIAGRSDEHYRQRVLGLTPDAGARMGA